MDFGRYLAYGTSPILSYKVDAVQDQGVVSTAGGDGLPSVVLTKLEKCLRHMGLTPFSSRVLIQRIVVRDIHHCWTLLYFTITLPSLESLARKTQRVKPFESCFTLSTKPYPTEASRCSRWRRSERLSAADSCPKGKSLLGYIRIRLGSRSRE